MELNRIRMYTAYMKMENFSFIQISDDEKIGVVKRSDITEFYKEVVLPAFDHIEAFEAENKALKEKLEAIEANKVAEFTAYPAYGDEGELNSNDGSNNRVFLPHIHKILTNKQYSGNKHYTVTISKETKEDEKTR